MKSLKEYEIEIKKQVKRAQPSASNITYKPIVNDKHFLAIVNYNIKEKKLGALGWIYQEIKLLFLCPSSAKSILLSKNT